METRSGRGAPRDVIPLCNQINTANGNASAVDIRPRCKSPSRVPLIEFEGDNDDESQRSDRDTPSPTHTFSKQRQARLRVALQLFVLKVIDSAKANCKGHVQHAYEMKGNTRSSSVIVIEDKEKKMCSFVMPSSGYDEKCGVVGLAESQMRES